MEKQQYPAGILTATTIYKDGFVFINGTLSYFTMPEGRVLNNSGTLSQQFIITDQQGNARITFDNSGTGGTAKVLQENSYYAFGMVMAGSPVAAPAVPNKNLYNGGSEWQNDYTNQPDVYQTFNRNYDAAIGRFVGVDPDPESAESMTNYQYAGNNPIMNNDPGGNLIKTPGLSEGIPSYYNTISGMQNAGPSLIDGDPNEGPDSGPIGMDIYADRLAGMYDGGGGSVGGSEPDYSAYWGNIIGFANDLLTGINNNSNWTSSGVDFKNIGTLDELAYTNPGSYNLSFHDGGVIISNVGEGGNGSANNPNSGGFSGSGATVTYAMNSGDFSYLLNANQGGNPAGNMFRIAGYLPPNNGANKQVWDLCTFYSTSEIINHYGGNTGGYDIFNDFLAIHNLGRQQREYIDDHGANAYSVLSLFVNGYETNDIISALLQGYPVSATLTSPPYASSSMNHQVFITGFSVYYFGGYSVGFYFNFWNSQTGTYNYLSPNKFSFPFAVTGIK